MHIFIDLNNTTFACNNDNMYGNVNNCDKTIDYTNICNDTYAINNIECANFEEVNVEDIPVNIIHTNFESDFNHITNGKLNIIFKI